MSTSSRYPATVLLALETADGRTVGYLPRRFLPRPESLPVAGTLVLPAGQRTDVVAALALGDPELTWLLADANRAVHPTDLGRPGAVLVVPGAAVLGGTGAL